jgi:anti-anti-sigma regulatory factor
MLRITENRTATDTVLLLLEGQVARQWVKLAREVCGPLLAQHQQVILDLAGVTFADRSGIQFLQSLPQPQVRLRNCSPFLREQLKGFT